VNEVPNVPVAPDLFILTGSNVRRDTDEVPSLDTFGIRTPTSVTSDAALPDPDVFASIRTAVFTEDEPEPDASASIRTARSTDGVPSDETSTVMDSAVVTSAEASPAPATSAARY